MAHDPKFSGTLKNNQQNAITTTLGANATMTLYSGTKPSGPDTGLNGDNKALSVHTCSATFAGSAVNGILTVNAIGAGTGTSDAGTGTLATWARIAESGGPAHIDCTVGIKNSEGYDCELDNPNIAEDQVVNISSFTLTNGN